MKVLHFLRQLHPFAYLCIVLMAAEARFDPRPSLRCIENLYDKIFNVNSGDGQNLDLIQQTIHDDWKIRPKLKKNEPEGPQGLKHMMAHYSVMFHDLHFIRKQTLSSRYVSFLEKSKMS